MVIITGSSATASWTFEELAAENVVSIEPEAVSADGSTVVGSATFLSIDDGTTRAFRWRAVDGVQELGAVAGGGRSTALAVSADGSVIVGEGRSAFGYDVGFRKEGDTDNLPVFNFLSSNPEPDAAVTAVSADGMILAGYHRDDNDTVRSFVWEYLGGGTGQFTDLGVILPGTVRSNGLDTNRVEGMSADGRYLTGWSDSANGEAGYFRPIEAFRYDRDTGTALGLGFLPGGRTYSSADAISADGTVIAGEAGSAISDREIFYWTESGGMVGTGRAFSSGEIVDITLSGDGSTILTSTDGRASIWTVADGWIYLETLIPELAGWEFSVATASSHDAGVIAGWGYPPGSSTGTGNELGWVAVLEAIAPSERPSLVIESSGSMVSLLVGRLEPGAAYALESSTTLSGWEVESTFTAPAEGVYSIPLSEPLADEQFFRIVWPVP